MDIAFAAPILDLARPVPNRSFKNLAERGEETARIASRESSSLISHKQGNGFYHSWTPKRDHCAEVESQKV